MTDDQLNPEDWVGRMEAALTRVAVALEAGARPQVRAPAPGQPEPDETRHDVPWGKIADAYAEVAAGLSRGGALAAVRGDGWTVKSEWPSSSSVTITIRPGDLP